MVVGATPYPPGRGEIRPVRIIVCARLSICIWSDDSLNKVLGNEVGFDKTLYQGTMVG
jgi:hypothetical protein